MQPVSTSTVKRLTRGGNLTGIPDSPLTIEVATLLSGQLLNAELGLNADSRGLYASQGLLAQEKPILSSSASLFPCKASVFFCSISDDLGDSVILSFVSGAGLNASKARAPRLDAH